MILGSESSSHPSLVAEHYDQLDPFYRKIWGEHLHHGLWQTGRETKDEAVEALCRLVIACAEIEPGARVCDVGSGYGALARLIAREAGAFVTGFTVSRAQWQYARALSGGDPKQSFLLLDWMQNGLNAGSCGCVVAIESSEHIADKKQFCAEVFRVLRAGGRFAITAWLSREQPGGLESAYLLRPICIEGRLPSLVTASEYGELLNGAGFTSLQFEDLTDRVRKTWSVCIRRFAAAIVRDGSLRGHFLSRNFTNRRFALTLFRLWLAYRTRSIRYGIFWGRK